MPTSSSKQSAKASVKKGEYFSPVQLQNFINKTRKKEELKCQMTIDECGVKLSEILKDVEVLTKYRDEFSEFLNGKEIEKTKLINWLHYILKILKNSCLQLNFQKMNIMQRIKHLTTEQQDLKNDLAFAITSTTRNFINAAYAASLKKHDEAQKDLEMNTSQASLAIKQISDLEGFFSKKNALPDVIFKLAEETLVSLDTCLNEKHAVREKIIEYIAMTF